MTAETRERIDEAEYLARLKDLVAASWPKGVARETEFPLGEMPISEHLAHWGRETPDAPAIIYYGREVSYGELDAQANRFAALLKSKGIGKGDRVAVFLPNCPQFHFAFYGILKIGAVHCPVSPMSTSFELSYMLGDTGARALVTLDAMMPVVREAEGADRLDAVWTASLNDMAPDEPTMRLPEAVAAPRIACDDAEDLLAALAAMPADPHDGASLDAIAALNYTGGTTGMPKGCVHTQRDMLWTAAANWSVLRGTPEQEARVVWCSFFPEFWIAGENAALLYPVLNGRPLVLMTRWDPLALLQAIERHKVTSIALVVDGALELMERPDFSDFDLSSLRMVRVVSFIKKLDRDIRRRWFERTGTVLSESAWGMTETHTSNTYTSGMQDDDFDLKQQPVFVGLPVPGNEFKICDFDTGEILPLDAEGEIVFRGVAMLKEYWNKPEATAEAIRDGWLHTGDIGVIDSMGYLHYLGRRKEMLKVRGMSVFPAELEAILGKHENVMGSGVVGRADERAGQIPVAFVTVRPGSGLDAETLRGWLGERVASYKLPEIRIVEGLPMTATGKVRKTELAKIAEGSA